MACIFDYILLIDKEATCWNTVPPFGMESEIIEIGICPVDLKTLEIGEPRSIIVKPERSTVSKFCTDLTGITQGMVDKGIPLKEAFDILRYEYQSRKRIWASWGNYDRKLTERLCITHRLPYPYGPSHINFKSLFSVMHQLDEELGMSNALEFLNMPLKGQHHRGVDDAYNIARLWIETFKRKENEDR